MDVFLLFLNQNAPVYALAFAAILLLLWIIRLEMRFRRLRVGKDAKSLDDSLRHIRQELTVLRNFEKKTVTYLATADKRLKKSIQGVATIRFNPFRGNGGGGNQSFASAFLNEDGDGVVISSIYSRDHTSVFSKPIVHRESNYELTEEEKEAMEHAYATLIAPKG